MKTLVRGTCQHSPTLANNRVTNSVDKRSLADGEPQRRPSSRKEHHSTGLGEPRFRLIVGHFLRICARSRCIHTATNTDPPFNTAQTFASYEDNLEHSIWLTMMRDRLLHIKKLLAENGSIWVHLDDVENHRMRLLMDEVFGSANFVAEVIWQRVASPKNSAKHLSDDNDFILIYAKDKGIWRRNKLPRPHSMNSIYSNPDNDPRGPWTSGSFNANKPYSAGVYPVKTPSGRVIAGPPAGTYWRYSEESLREMDADNRIWWGSKQESSPRIKRFLSEVDGAMPRTLWPHTEVGHGQTASNEMKSLFPNQVPFSTPKPERLLERIIHIGSNPGDIVLDVFAGSGTTAAVAQKMGRRWVTCELLEPTFATFTRPRLEMVCQ